MWWDSMTTRQFTAHYHRSHQQEPAPVLVLVGGVGQNARAIHVSSRSVTVHPSAFEWSKARRRGHSGLTTGAINRRAKLQANPHYRQTNTQLSTGRIPFLSPNQQCQSTETICKASQNFTNCCLMQSKEDTGEPCICIEEINPVTYLLRTDDHVVFWRERERENFIRNCTAGIPEGL